MTTDRFAALRAALTIYEDAIRRFPREIDFAEHVKARSAYIDACSPDVLRALLDAADERDRLICSVRAQVIASATRRAERAEAERDRLAGELERAIMRAVDLGVEHDRLAAATKAGLDRPLYRCSLHDWFGNKPCPQCEAIAVAQRELRADMRNANEG